jgi:hypothetical protein
MNEDETGDFPSFFRQLFLPRKEIEVIETIEEQVINKWFLPFKKSKQTVNIELLADSFIDEVLGGERKALSHLNLLDLLDKLIECLGSKIGNELYKELRWRENLISPKPYKNKMHGLFIGSQKVDEVDEEETIFIGPIERRVLNEWFLKQARSGEKINIELLADSFIDEVLGGERKTIPFSMYSLLGALMKFFGYKIGNELYEELRYRGILSFD